MTRQGVKVSSKVKFSVYALLLLGSACTLAAESPALPPTDDPAATNPKGSAGPEDMSRGSLTSNMPTRPSSGLKYFSERPDNGGAATFNIGDRFLGPGFVTVGWLGAKKQIVLPAGEWVVLSAVDHLSGGSGDEKLATFSFGKFDANQLGAALSVTVSRHSSRVSNWTDITACEAPDEKHLYQSTVPRSAMRRDCVRMTSVAQTFANTSVGNVELRASLDRMGARMGGTAIVSTMYFWDKANGYMRVARVDWPETSFGVDRAKLADWQPATVAASGERTAYVETLVTWVENYRKVAVEGFRRALAGNDLVPGARRVSGIAGVGEFEPASRSNATPK